MRTQGAHAMSRAPPKLIPGPRDNTLNIGVAFGHVLVFRAAIYCVLLERSNMRHCKARLR